MMPPKVTGIMRTSVTCKASNGDAIKQRQGRASKTDLNTDSKRPRDANAI
jgi:hypothetical protein